MKNNPNTTHDHDASSDSDSETSPDPHISPLMMEESPQSVARVEASRLTLPLLDSAGDTQLSPSPSPLQPKTLHPTDNQSAQTWSSSAAGVGTGVASPPSPSAEIVPEEPPQCAVSRSQTFSDNERSFRVGQVVFYVEGEGESHTAIIKNIDYVDKMHTFYTIAFNGTEVPNVHHDALYVVHPVVDKVLGVLNLRDETDNYLRQKYPTLKLFEDFLKLSVEVVKAKYKNNGKSKAKEPQFKRRDCEEFIILCRWTEKNQVKGKINWGYFNDENFNEFREQASKDDLFEILKELGIYNDKVVNTLKAKSVQTPAHFVQKPKSWYNKLCEEESGTEENSKQTKHPLLTGVDKYAIEKFKDWYNFHFIGYLPSDWIASFQNGDVHQKERDLRKVLRVIGLKADAIRALKMNDIRDIATLNRTSEEWKTQGARNTLLSSITAPRDAERAGRSNEWKDMGLTRNDASDIINFRHWYNFYVAGKKNMKGWVTEFNGAQYNNFLQRYEPGDDFKKPSPWKFRQHDVLNFSQESHNYYDMLQKAAESGEVTDKQRYHLLKYMEKREKMSLIEEITSHHYEGLGDSTLQQDRLRELLLRDEQEADEKDKGDLLFGQQFSQFFFSAFLVLVLLVSLILTTVYFMVVSWKEKNVTGFKRHPGFDYVTFIHNVLFGLVTAVVIQELGEEATETSLYYRFLPTYRDQRRRQREHRILNRNNAEGFRSRIVEGSKTYLMGLILWSTRIYIIFWISLGTASLVFGAVEGLDTSNPLYTTGQTWLGIAVTIGYTYFGLHGKDAPKHEDANNKIDQSNKDDDIDGSDAANGREEARFTEPTVKAASASKKKQEVAKVTPATPSSGKVTKATSARKKKNSSAPFSSGTKVQPTLSGNSTAPSTSKEKQAAEVTPCPPSFKGMKLLGHYSAENGKTFEKYQATPDGNCLPYAVNGSNDIRKMIQTRDSVANYIELRRSYYETFFPNSEKVIYDIRKVGTPLGHEFLQVFADWTGDTIISYVTVEDGDDRVFLFTPSKEFDSASPSGETRFVIFNNENHWDSLRPTDNSSKEEAHEDSCEEDDEEGGLVGSADSDKSDDDDDISSIE